MAKILEGLSRGWTGPRHGQPYCGWARKEAEGGQGQGHPSCIQEAAFHSEGITRFPTEDECAGCRVEHT